MRDYTLCWIMSIMFEFLEMSFEHMLPNFKECWWDHLILDILVCNWSGFYLGMKTAEFFTMKQYGWFQPDKYEWDSIKGWKKFLSALVLMTFVVSVELSQFFLKFVLWIPPSNKLTIGRLLIWWGIGLPGAREFYQWVTDPNCKKLGSMAWMCCACLCSEILIEVKYGKGMFPNPHPPHIIGFWVVLSAIAITWGIYSYGVPKFSMWNSTSSISSSPAPSQTSSSNSSNQSSPSSSNASNQSSQPLRQSMEPEVEVERSSRSTTEKNTTTTNDDSTTKQQPFERRRSSRIASKSPTRKQKPY